MATVPVPRIRREDYPSILALSKFELPQTFDEWRDRRAQEEGQLRQAGFVIEFVDIEPKKLGAFCRERGVSVSEDAIKGFVEEESRRQNHTKAGRDFGKREDGVLKAEDE